METHRQSECNVQECSSSSELMRTQNYFDHKIKDNTSVLCRWLILHIDYSLHNLREKQPISILV
jgi:hypothetical protein